MTFRPANGPGSPFVAALAALCIGLAFALAASGDELTPARPGIYNPLHGYETRDTADRFTALLRSWEEAPEGRSAETLDTSGDLPFLLSLLKELEVPVSSQMLVFTATSLQKGLISARNPRALYFNDDTYVGYVPRGRIEVISLDPELGGIFYIFDRLQPGYRPAVRRSSECMNCHAPRHLDNIPGLVVESVVPGLTGGGERAFRRERSGHSIPLGDRFGGWHLTGAGEAMPHNWSNMLLIRKNGQAIEEPNPPGERCDLSRYPLETSDLLAQLLHEHQIGFVNRALRAGYRYRELAAAGTVDGAALRELSTPLVEYLLFTDEAALAPGTIGDSPFASDFQAVGKRDAAGRSLRDLELQTHLLRYRCSYMIYSPVYTGLPEALRRDVYSRLASALGSEAPADEASSAHLPAEERQAIREILAATLPEFAELSQQ